MEVIGDSLYAFIPRTGTIYSWKVEDIIQQKDYAPLKVSRSQEFKLRSISKTGDKDKFFVSMLKDGKIQLAEYSLADFQARNFANPLRCFTADDMMETRWLRDTTYIPGLASTSWYHGCWNYGEEDEVHDVGNNRKYILKDGMEFKLDERGYVAQFENGLCPRFTTPYENGNVILDYCFYVK